MKHRNAVSSGHRRAIPARSALGTRIIAALVTLSVLFVATCSFPAPMGVPGCTGNPDCDGSNAVCDVGASGVCVECLPGAAAACTGASPVCGGTSCRACKTHAECGSGACLPDGSCGDDRNVAYVAPAPKGTDSAECSKAVPCSVLRRAIETGRSYVKITGSIDDALALDNKNVTLLGDPDAKLSPTRNGAVLEVRGNSDVHIYDLELTGGAGTSGFGLYVPAGTTAKVALTRAKVSRNAAGGIVVSSGTLTVAQSSVSGNAGGGISVSGANFDITNTFVIKNGGATSTFGGVRLSDLGVGTFRFEFNTVSVNAAMAGATAGVTCGIVAQPLTLKSSIVYANLLSGGGAQVGGDLNCNWTYSDIGPEGVAGMGNVNMNPNFINANADDFSVPTSSGVKDLADPDATLMIDFEGDARPQGARRDIGADEITER